MHTKEVMQAASEDVLVLHNNEMSHKIHFVLPFAVDFNCIIHVFLGHTTLLSSIAATTTAVGGKKLQYNKPNISVRQTPVIKAVSIGKTFQYTEHPSSQYTYEVYFLLCQDFI